MRYKYLAVYIIVCTRSQKEEQASHRVKNMHKTCVLRHKKGFWPTNYLFNILTSLKFYVNRKFQKSEYIKIW